MSKKDDSKSFDFKIPLKTDDGEHEIIIEFNAEVYRLAMDYKDALIVARGLCDPVAINSGWPTVMQVSGTWGLSIQDATDKCRTDMAMQIDRAEKDGIGYALLNGIFEEKFFKATGKIEIKPKIPIDLPKDWWDMEEVNKRRAKMMMPMIDDLTRQSPVEQGVAYVRQLLHENPRFAIAFGPLIEQRINGDLDDIIAEAHREVDDEGFRPGDLGSDMVASTSPDVSEEGTNPVGASEIPAGDEVIGESAG